MSDNNTITEKDLFSIYNENNGYTIATNGIYVAIGNPNTYNFSMVEGIARLGEVRVYKKNINKNNDYSLYFICTPTILTINDRNLYKCFPITDTNSSIIYQSKYGKSISISDNLLIIGDYDCLIEREPCKLESMFRMGRVDIYDLSEPKNNIYKTPIFTFDPSVNINTDDIINETYGIPYQRPKPSDNDVCIIEENHEDEDFLLGFGKSISISDKFICIGCPYSINKSIDNDTSWTDNYFDENEKYKNKYLNRPGVVLLYEYEITNENKFSLVNPHNPYCLTYSISDIEVNTHKNIKDYNLKYTPAVFNFGKHVKISKDSSVLSISYYILSNYVNNDLLDEFIFEPRVNIYKLQKNKTFLGCGGDNESHNLYVDNEWSIVNGGILKPIDHISKAETVEFLEYPVNRYCVKENKEADIVSNLNFDFGCSVSFLSSGFVFVGSPQDIEYSTHVMSDKSKCDDEHIKYIQRGSCYVYRFNTFGVLKFATKLYGDENVFNNNLFGVSIASDNDFLVVGSPKNNIPFSSKYLKNTLTLTEDNICSDFSNVESFNGQVILYKIIDGKCEGDKEIETVTTHPISLRKVYNESYKAFGFSVDISTENVVVGAPCILYDDLNLIYPYNREPVEGLETIGPYYDHPWETNELQTILGASDGYFDSLQTGENNNTVNNIVYGKDTEVFSSICGQGYIYNFTDLIKNYHVGNVFYNNNRIIINTDGNICSEFFKHPHNNKISLQGTINSKLTIYEKQYICTIDPGEFNVPTNPTAYDYNKMVYPYMITNKIKFTFNDLDYILRYMCVLTNKNEMWWNYIDELNPNKSTLIDDGVEKSIFDYYVNTLPYSYKSENILSKQLKNIISTFKLDINNDNIIDINDICLLWKCFANTLNQINYKKYISDGSKRTEYDDVIVFIHNNMGLTIKTQIKKDFYRYHQNSFNDPLGSYLAPYITQVGLYSNTDLVVVGKLGNPIKNTGEIPINIVVKWDV